MVYVENGALQSAIDNAAVGETLVLTSDITLNSRINVSNIVTIDLNGYTITGNIDDYYGAIYIGTKGVLTINDSSPKKTGSIINTTMNAIGNYGIVNIYGGTFIGNYALCNFYYNSTVYGTAVIYGGTFKTYEGDYNSIVNSGDLTINGGHIQHLNTTNVLNVTDGTIDSLYIGVADYNPEKQSTSIAGGNIMDLSVGDGSDNNVSISGGTFGCEVDNQYLADGFELSYNESTGTYGIVTDSDGSNSGLKVIATSSSRIRDLVIRDNQLIFIRDLGRIAFDSQGKRVFYNQIVELDTDADRLALVNPIGGYYFVIGTAVLWYYKNGWIQITSSPQDIVFMGVELPQLGQQGKIYIDTDDQEISVWNEETKQYIVVSNYTNDVTQDDIEDLFD